MVNDAAFAVWGEYAVLEDLNALLPGERWDELNNRFSSEEPMDWEDVIQLHEDGVIIGSHCHDHALLHERESASEIDRQLRLSKQLIEDGLNVCKYFVYPNGTESDISPNAVNAVDSAGYALGISSVRADVHGECDRQILPRLRVASVPGSLELQLSVRFVLNARYDSWSSDVIRRLPSYVHRAD